MPWKDCWNTRISFTTHTCLIIQQPFMGVFPGFQRGLQWYFQPPQRPRYVNHNDQNVTCNNFYLHNYHHMQLLHQKKLLTAFSMVSWKRTFELMGYLLAQCSWGTVTGRSTWKDWLTLGDIPCIHIKTAVRPAGNEVRNHTTFCTSECVRRQLQWPLQIGCGKLWVTDGIWKLTFPHCMYRCQVRGCISAFSSILTLYFHMTVNGVYTYPIECCSWYS